MLDIPSPGWASPSPLPGSLVTERLEIRRYREGDGDTIFAAIDANRTALLPWMTWALKGHQSPAECSQYVRDQLAAYESKESPDFAMGIFRRSDGELIGGTGLHRIRQQLGEAEIGYWVAASARGHGVCTESTASLISAAFRPAEAGGWGLRRIVISCAALNRGSVRVCEKLGVRRESVRQADRWFAGSADIPAGYIDSHTYAVLNPEWDINDHRRRP